MYTGLPNGCVPSAKRVNLITVQRGLSASFHSIDNPMSLILPICTINHTHVHHYNARVKNVQI